MTRAVRPKPKLHWFNPNTLRFFLPTVVRMTDYTYTKTALKSGRLMSLFAVRFFNQQVCAISRIQRRRNAVLTTCSGSVFRTDKYSYSADSLGNKKYPTGLQL